MRTAKIPADTFGTPLTDNQLKVLQGMSRGLMNAEIAQELFLSEYTVKSHAWRLYKKLGAADRAHAVAIGYTTGLLKSPRLQQDGVALAQSVLDGTCPCQLRDQASRLLQRAMRPEVIA